jgi:hypothetical protein
MVPTGQARYRDTSWMTRLGLMPVIYRYRYSIRYTVKNKPINIIVAGTGVTRSSIILPEPEKNYATNSEFCPFKAKGKGAGSEGA